MKHSRIWERLAGREGGNALIGALLVLLVLTAVGTTYVAMTKTETQIAGQEKRHVQSMYNAEAGISEALARMSASRDSNIYFGEDLTAAAPSPGWGRYMVMASGNSSKDPDIGLAATDGLDNDGDGQVDESGEEYPEVTTKQSGSNTVAYPWVKVRYRLNNANQVVLYGDHDNSDLTPPCANLVRGVPIIIVSSEGAQGTADRRIQVEAVKSPVSAPKAAIYAESDNFKFNGVAFLVSGQDWDPATGTVVAGNPQVDGIQTTKDPANITNEIKNNQTNNVEGNGAEPSVASAPLDYDLESMAASYASMADIHQFTGDAGNYDEYHIVDHQGDLHVTGQQIGGGVIVIHGDLICTGQFTWYGLVIVLGTIDFAGGGAGIHIWGSMLTTGGFTLQNTVGGNADVLYSSAALAKLAAFSPYKVSAWTELP